MLVPTLKRYLFLVLIAVIATIYSAPAAAGPSRDAEQAELRGIWITNVDSDVLTSKEKIVGMMDYLDAMNFNIIFPVMWNKGYTLYPSAIMEAEFGRKIDPVYGDRDPLAELIAEAHARDIAVVPWFEYGFASRFDTGAKTRLEGQEDPDEGGFLLQQRPEWRAIDHEGYLVEKNSFEWMNAFDPEVQDFMLSIMIEVVENYDIDGVQGDDRLPALASTAGYDAKTIARYRDEFGQDPPADPADAAWLQWRADILSDFLARWRAELKAVDENLILSSSPSPYPWSLNNYLQDAKTWMARGLPDMLHTQVYRYNAEAYKGTLNETLGNTIGAHQLDAFSPGILIKSGPYVIEPEMLGEKIALNRQMGVGGHVLFFYEGLNANDKAVGQYLMNGPFAEPARMVPGLYYKLRPQAPVMVTLPADPTANNDDSTIAQVGEWQPYGAAADEAAYWKLDAPTNADGVLYQLGSDDLMPGSYKVLAKLPADSGLASEALYRLRYSVEDTSGAKNAGSTEKIFSQKHETSQGWTEIGSFEWTPNAKSKAFLQVKAGEGSSGALVVGPICIVIDARHARQGN